MYTLTCKLCGKTFQSQQKTTRFCKGHHTMICHQCGKEFCIDNNLPYYYEHRDTACCCKSCASKYKFSHQTEEQRQKRNNARKQAMLKKYGVENPGQLQEVIEKRERTCLEKYGCRSPQQNEQIRQKTRETNKAKYGVEYTFQSEEVKSKIKDTVRKRYGADHISKTEQFHESIKRMSREKYGTDYPIQSKKVRDKIHSTTMKHFGVNQALESEKVRDKGIETIKKRYGVDNPAKSDKSKKKALITSRSRYGTDYPMQNPLIRSKQVRSARKSLLETRVYNLLSQYNIEFEQQYVISKNGHTHAFDFYVPKYKILLDADGQYYHSYLSDPDGKHVRDDYDEVRMYLVPEDHVFLIAVEGNEERTIRDLYKTIKKMDEGVFDYEGELFTWCREVGFPYPHHDEKRMIKDWSHLCQYENRVYRPNCRFAMSIVSNFHKSIYDCHVGSYPSPRQAWDDDDLLKKVISNRLIYQNTVNPSKVLAGFNVSKVAPIVSRFNPVLARNLVQTYLSGFNEVFDPFSGFSGRLLGVASCDKKYIGQDIRQVAVDESNQIIEFLSLSNCTVTQKDVLQSTGSYECLLTCSPYSTKETYGHEADFKTCDEWIDECLNRFKCKKYVFVVDKTEKYKEYAVEDIQNSSHFSKSVEKVIVI